MNSRTEKIQLSLLNAAITDARARSDFYARELANDFSLQSIEQFAEIPLIEKDALAELSWAQLLSADTPPKFLGITSGSEYDPAKRPLLRIRREMARELFEQQITSFGDQLVLKPLSIRIANVNHGSQLIEANSGVFSLPLEVPYHLNVIELFLRQEFAFDNYLKNVSVLMAPLQALKALSKAFEVRGIDPSDFHLTNIASYAWRLSSKWKSYLEAFWGASVTDIYGLSEVPGLMAAKCEYCGDFHFSKACYTEFLDIDSNIPSENGLSRLVATSYTTSGSEVPIIRYDTGDLFRLNGICTHTNQLRCEFVGRKSNVVLINGSTKELVSAGMISDVLDNFDDVSRVQNPRVDSLIDSRLIGNPIFDFELSERTLNVSVSVNAERAAADNRVLQQEITTALSSALKCKDVEPLIRLTEEPLDSARRY